MYEMYLKAAGTATTTKTKSCEYFMRYTDLKNQNFSWCQFCRNCWRHNIRATIDDNMTEVIMPIHDANFVVTGGIVVCHNDNLRSHQWRQIWHHDNPRFSVCR